MTHLTESRINRTLQIIIQSALANERCPQNAYGVGVESAALTRLAKTGWLRIEYSSNNFRCVHILKGKHAGKSTAPDTSGNQIYSVLDHRGVTRLLAAVPPHRQSKRKPTLPRLNFMEQEDIA